MPIKKNAKKIHSSFIYNSTNLEITQMSMRSRMESKLWHIHTVEYSTAMKKKTQNCWYMQLICITLPRIIVNERN